MSKILTLEQKIEQLKTELAEEREREQKKREARLLAAARKAGLLSLPHEVIEREFTRIAAHSKHAESEVAKHE